MTSESSGSNNNNNSKRFSSPIRSSKLFLNKKASSVLSSLPFRYAFASDGCAGTSNSKKSNEDNITNSNNNNNTNLNLLNQNYSSSSLIGRISNTGSTSEIDEKNDENLFKVYGKSASNSFNLTTTNNESSSPDLINSTSGSPYFFGSGKSSRLFFCQDDSSNINISTTNSEADEEHDKFNENHSSNSLSVSHQVDSLFDTIYIDSSSLNTLINSNTSTLPNNKYTDEASSLTRYGIRRHHSAPQNDAKWLQAKRKAIVVQMYDTEKSYVEALKILVQKYYLPLKEKDIVERKFINDVFYKIPEIHVHHELLLSSLKSKFDSWDNRQTIGDILLNIFAKQSVVETYISFVNNYRTSQEAIRICKDQTSLFTKFLEQQAKDHRGKLTLKDLIIQPVQRIPRYELYVKDFLQCTPKNHPDYILLMRAQKELHNLAEKIDQVHKEVNETYGSDSQSALQIIQDLIENLDDLVNPYRYYIRHDIITIVSSSGGVKKDRCIFLFSDLVILTSCKRRSGNINKKTNTIILNSPIGKQYLESFKHKLIMRFQLEDIDLTVSNLNKNMSVEKDYLEEDLLTLTRINELVRSIAHPHHNLDESIKDITASIIKQLNESIISSSISTSVNTSSQNNQLSVSNSNSPQNNSLNSPNSSSLASTNSNLNANNSNNNNSGDSNDIKQKQTILTINTIDRIDTMTIVFLSSDQRHSWEKCFIDAKKIFYESCSRKPATFLSTIAIPRNRSGVQFTCATARLFLNNNPNDIWICSTDGQMGQITIMNTVPDLNVSSCNTIFSSIITCMACAPPYRLKRTSGHHHHKKQMENSSSINDGTDNDQDYKYEAQQLLNNTLASIKNPKLQAFANINSLSVENSSNNLTAQSSQEQESSLIDYDSSDDEEIDGHSGAEDKDSSTNNSNNNNNIVVNIPFNLQTNTLGNISLFTASTIGDNKHSTIWIGNDDGSLHIFQFNDTTIRTVAKRNRITKQFSSSVHSLCYMDNKVFASLKNGELAVFKRIYSIWNYDSYSIKTIVPNNSFSCMIPVAGKLWCSYANNIMILNPNTLNSDHHITIEGEKNIHLASGGTSSWTVWVGCLNTLDIKLYHATKFIVLAEINVKHCISQKLAGLDELIKLHKLSCLKITCLYVCKDTLWIGTSAGIILNVKIPHVNNTTHKLNSTLSFYALNNGHVGPVRFITSVEVLKNQPVILTQNSTTSENTGKDQSGSSANNTTTTTSLYKTIVMTGGEGYEEYKGGSGGTNTSSFSNSSVGNSSYSNSLNAITNQQLSDMAGVGNTGSPGNTSSLLSNSSVDESLIGKDDLTNFVLTWEI